METFSALPALCEGNPPFTGRFLSGKGGNTDFDILFDISYNK